VDRTLATFRIAEQLAASGVNAVLVLAEGAKDAPDSFGGKLEEAGVFSRLVADVLGTLKERGVVEKPRPGSIVLAGHSGAYRVISFILLRGGLTDNVREVYLFDALYGELEKFAWWVEHSRGRLVVIHTPGGGTRTRTLDFIDDLRPGGSLRGGRRERGDGRSPPEEPHRPHRVVPRARRRRRRAGPAAHVSRDRNARPALRARSVNPVPAPALKRETPATRAGACC
jgi:hypothetical protein